MTQINDQYKNQMSHHSEYPNQNSNQNSNSHEGSINAKDFLIGTLIGGMVGAATALFLAPKSGRELREDLNTHAGTLKEKGGQWRETAMEKGNGLAAAAKEKTSGITKTVQDQVNKVKSKNNNDAENEGEEQLPVETEQNDAQELNQRLEETKKAFDETEQSIHQ